MIPTERIRAVYAATVVLRYALTMTLHPEMRWLGDVIPVMFHFVLSGFIYVLGHHHLGTRQDYR